MKDDAERALPDPNDPSYERARVAMAARLSAIGRNEPKSGYGRKAEYLLSGELMEVPTWLALGMLAAQKPEGGNKAVSALLGLLAYITGLSDELRWTPEFTRYVNERANEIAAMLDVAPIPDPKP